MQARVYDQSFLGSAFECPTIKTFLSKSVVSGKSAHYTVADNMTPTDALTILDDVPKELRGHVAMTGVAAKAVEVLANA